MQYAPCSTILANWLCRTRIHLSLDFHFPLASLPSAPLRLTGFFLASCLYPECSRKTKRSKRQLDKDDVPLHSPSSCGSASLIVMEPFQGLHRIEFAKLYDRRTCAIRASSTLSSSSRQPSISFLFLSVPIAAPWIRRAGRASEGGKKMENQIKSETQPIDHQPSLRIRIILFSLPLLSNIHCTPIRKEGTRISSLPCPPLRILGVHPSSATGKSWTPRGS